MSYSIHDAVGIDHKVTLAKLGEVTEKELQTLKKLYPKSGTTIEPSWPAKLNQRDLNLARKYKFDAKMATDVEELDYAGTWFVGFGFNNIKEVNTLATKYYPKLKSLPIENAGCQSFFAHIHNDTHNGDSRSKVIFIVDNPIGHRLFSKDNSRMNHICTPKAGEIIFLDTYCDHAVFPNTSLGFETMVNNPMKLLIVETR